MEVVGKVLFNLCLFVRVMHLFPETVVYYFYANIDRMTLIFRKEVNNIQRKHFDH